MLFQIPHGFLADEAERLGFSIQPPGRYGVAMVFEPKDAHTREACRDLLFEALAHCGLTVLGRRAVPTDASVVGQEARTTEPVVTQFFVGAPDMPEAELERRLYRARKRAEGRVRESINCESLPPKYLSRD